MTTTTTIGPADLEPSAATVVDVRTPAEFGGGRVPGSQNVPLDLLQRHADEVAGMIEDGVVLVCRSGPRAERARQALAAKGRSAVVLDGGVLGWLDAGRDVEGDDDEVWAMDRQVRFVAGGLVLASGLASLRWPRAGWLGTAVGAGLFNSAVTDTCAMASVLGKLPYNQRGADPGIDEVRERLGATA